MIIPWEDFTIAMIALSALDLTATYWIMREARKQGIKKAETQELNPILPTFWKAWGLKKGTIYFAPIAFTITILLAFCLSQLLSPELALLFAGIWIGCDFMIFQLHISNIVFLTKRGKQHEQNLHTSNG